MGGEWDGGGYPPTAALATWGTQGWDHSVPWTSPPAGHFSYLEVVYLVVITNLITVKRWDLELTSEMFRWM